MQILLKAYLIESFLESGLVFLQSSSSSVDFLLFSLHVRQLSL